MISILYLFITGLIEATMSPVKFLYYLMKKASEIMGNYIKI